MPSVVVRPRALADRYLGLHHHNVVTILSLLSELAGLSIFDPGLAPLRLRSGQALGCILTPLRGFISV